MNDLIMAFALISMPNLEDWQSTPVNPAEAVLVSCYIQPAAAAAVCNELLDAREYTNWSARFAPLEVERPQPFGWPGAPLPGAKLPQKPALVVSVTSSWQLGNVRRRVEELFDAPYICDRFRFPNLDAARTGTAMARQHMAALRTFIEPATLPGKEWVRQLKQDNDYCYRVWDHLVDIQQEMYYVTTRRQKLKELRDDLLGLDDYYEGRVPPPVPLWLFREIK